MNPLDLTGPEFLRFYFPYGFGVLFLAWLVRNLLNRSTASIPTARWAPGIYPRDTDAYAIAFLRGGRSEAVRTLLARLVSVDLLTAADDGTLRRGAGDEPKWQPIERVAWNTVKHNRASLPAGQVESQIKKAIGGFLGEIERELAEQGLLPDPGRKGVFRALSLLTWLAVVGLGLVKVWVALERGRTNIGFLVLLLIFFTIAIFRLLRSPRRTSAGGKYLDWLQESHRGLIWKAEPASRPAAGELALAAGIYGLTAVPDLAPLSRSFGVSDRRHQGSDGSSSGSSCSSSSSSSSDGGGSSCGGGCGGGGCGGCGG